LYAGLGEGLDEIAEFGREMFVNAIIEEN